MKVIERIQQIFLIVLIYLLCTRIKNKYDELIVIGLGIITIIKNIYFKEYFVIKKSWLYLLSIWILLITISFFKMKYSYTNGEYIQLYKEMMISNFLLFIILIQIDIFKLIPQKYFFLEINILSLYSVYKGMIFLKNNGLFVRGIAWGNPNYYSMVLGIFMIISFISFLYEKKIAYKLLYISLNLLQFFMMVSIGQSRNVLMGVIISYFLSIGIFYYKKIKLKSFIKLIYTIFIILFLSYCIGKYNNLRIVEISFEKFLKNPRILIWKKVLFEDKFNIFFGKGFAYYTINSFKDSVGVTIYAVHNDVLEFLVTQGLFSMLCYLSFIFLSVKNLIKEFFNKRKKEILIALILIVYFFLIGMLDLPFYLKKVTQFIFLFLAIAIKKEKILSKEGK